MLCNKVLSKGNMHFEEDFVSLTVVCYLKETRKELLINSHK